MFFARRIPVVNQGFGFFPKRIRVERLDEDTGFVRFENRPDNGSLPSQSDYDLETMLKAGVSLKATKTDIIPASCDEILESLENEEVKDEQ